MSHKPKVPYCMICDAEGIPPEEIASHDHPGHPDSGFHADGTSRGAEEAMKAQDRCHVGYMKRHGVKCECSTCKRAG